MKLIRAVSESKQVFKCSREQFVLKSIFGYFCNRIMAVREHLTSGGYAIHKQKR